MDADTLAQWSQQVHIERLLQAADGNTVDIVWQAIPRSERKTLALREVYFASLIRTGMHEKAEKELTHELKRNWNGSLVKLYGLAEAPDTSRQLNRAETWLRTRGEDADLLLAAARLCLRVELWGKARSYLETVISIRPSPEVYQVYGRLLAQLGDSDAAADAYRDGLNLVSDAKMQSVPLLGVENASDIHEPPRLESDNS